MKRYQLRLDRYCRAPYFVVMAATVPPRCGPFHTCRSECHAAILNRPTTSSLPVRGGRRDRPGAPLGAAACRPVPAAVQTTIRRAIVERCTSASAGGSSDLISRAVSKGLSDSSARRSRYQPHGANGPRAAAAEIANALRRTVPRSPSRMPSRCTPSRPWPSALTRPPTSTVRCRSRRIS